MNESEQGGFEADLTSGLPVAIVAEDNVLLRNLLHLILSHKHFAVLVAGNGVEALSLSRAFEGEIGLLLTDMEMPSMGGEQLSELIMQERPGIRVLQMSGLTEQHFAGRNLSIAFLKKPFTPKQLEAKISEVMRSPPGKIQVILERA